MQHGNIKELPKFQCHKVVRALKIKEVIVHAHPDPTADDAAFIASDAFQGAHLMPEDKNYVPIAVDAAFYRKHNPSAGGFFVAYEGGYTSFSPAAAFEVGYTPVVDTPGANEVDRFIASIVWSQKPAQIEIDQIASALRLYEIWKGKGQPDAIDCVELPETNVQSLTQAQP